MESSINIIKTLGENEMLSQDALQKRERLEYAKTELKKHFVGIDKEIDTLISHIEAWYIMPEILNRPVIVCLWGLTGVGKTDLVRRLASLLGMKDRFAEVQMNNRGWGGIGEVLREANLENNSHGILLLDEIQNYRTIDQDGHEMSGDSMSDIWSLLSDGKFSIDRSIRESLEWLHYELSCDIARMKETKNKTTGKKESKKSKSGTTPPPNIGEEAKSEANLDKLDHWTAKHARRLLKLPISTSVLVQQGKKALFERVSEAISKPEEIYKETSFEKLLIILSGNLDEVYSMSKKTDDIDTDADTFFERSKKITIVDVKSALKRRFKPEQISRFGNSHIIYPSLSSAAYREIIRRQLSDIKKRVAPWIDITFDPSVEEAIYKNGVFPAQGTRPVFSTVAAMVESKMPRLIMHAIENNYTSCTLSLKNGYLTNEKQFSIESPEVIENIRKSKTQGEITQIAVHEAGHILTYGILFKRTPLQATARTTNLLNDGFVLTPDEELATRSNLEKSLVVALAGQAAENLVFGSQGITNGASSDIEYSTSILKKMFQWWGMSHLKGKYEDIHILSNSGFSPQAFFPLSTPIDYDSIIQSKYDEATNLLSKHKRLFEDLTNALIDNNFIYADDIIKIFSKYGFTILNDTTPDFGLNIVEKKIKFFEDGKKEK